MPLLVGAQNTILSGRITSPVEDFITLHYIKNYITFDEDYQIVKLKEDGSFTFHMDLEKPQSFVLKYVEKPLTIFLEPNDSLYIKSSARYFARGPKDFTGRATAVAANEYLAEKPLKTYAYRDSKVREKIETYHFGQLMTYLNDTFQIKRNFVLDKADSEKMTDLFVSKEKQEIEFQSLYYKMLKYYESEESLPVDHLAEPIGHVSNMVPPVAEIPYYYYALDMGKYDLLEESWPAYDYLQAKKLYHETTKLCRLDNPVLNNTLQTQVSEFKNHTQNQSYLDAVLSGGACLENLYPGKYAPDFELRDINGYQYSLKGNRGRLIIVDFWATWCPPCVGAIQRAQKTINQYSDQVDFVFIAVGDDADKVKRYIQDSGWSGMFLLAEAGFESEVCKDYQIDGLPRTIVVEKDGKLTNTSVEKVGTWGFDGMIQSLLKK